MLRNIFILCLITLLPLTCKKEKEIKIYAWPNGIIYFKWGKSLTIHDKIKVNNAMYAWSSVCNIYFKYTPHKKIYVYSIKKVDNNINTSCSTVGYRKIAYLLFTKAASSSTLIHELGHCLGLKHEHQRPDRDKFIKIHWNNIDSRNKYNFYIYSQKSYLYPISKFPYDTASIMHYNKKAFSINKNDTIECLTACQHGNGSLSYWDKKKIQFIYGNR